MKLQTILTVLASLIYTTLASNIANVLTDISKQATALDNKVTAFSADSSLVTALGIHLDAVTLGTALDKATSDVNGASKPISQADGKTILTGLKALKPTILHALSTLVSNKAHFTKLSGISSLAKQDLINLNAHLSKFEAALVVSVPANLIPEGKAIRASVDAAVAKAIAAYS